MLDKVSARRLAISEALLACDAIDSLFIAYTQNGNHPGNEPQIRAAIKGLFQQLENPSAYDGFKFAQGMRALNSLL